MSNEDIKAFKQDIKTMLALMERILQGIQKENKQTESIKK
jgi:hypothetical protein